MNVISIPEKTYTSENQLQNAVVKRLMPLEEVLGFRVVAIPNGGKRRKREAQQLKNRGLRAGFPDLMILRMEDIDVTPEEKIGKSDCSFVMCVEYGKTILIELKQPKGVISDEQVEWHAWLNKTMFPVHVCTSVASVLTVLRGHGLKV